MPSAIDIVYNFNSEKYETLEYFSAYGGEYNKLFMRSMDVDAIKEIRTLSIIPF